MSANTKVAASGGPRCYRCGTVLAPASYPYPDVDLLTAEHVAAGECAVLDEVCS